jgi:SAM-dependent methyltransferase
MDKAKFDNAAHLYDATFTNTAVGRAQRNQVWKQIENMALSVPSSIVEVNCGTGEDAHFFKSKGHQVLATDLSSEMIQVAKTKFPSIDFQLSSINSVHQLTPQVDLLFSNFGGMNCIAAEQLQLFFKNSSTTYPKEHRLVLVIMGKKCIWDNLFLLLKGKWKQFGRRNTNKPLAVNVDGINVNTWYYSPQEILHLAAPYYQLASIHPIGLHVPPSYLASYFEKKPRFLMLLKWLDQHFTFSWQANYADHFMISLVPNEQSLS